MLMSVIGQHHISQRRVQGFYFWIVGNVAALILFMALGRWMTCMLYVYFLYKSVQGVIVWRRLDARPLAMAPLSPIQEDVRC